MDIYMMKVIRMIWGMISIVVGYQKLKVKWILHTKTNFSSNLIFWVSDPSDPNHHITTQDMRFEAQLVLRQEIG